MHYGLNLTSTPLERKWEHVRLETLPQLTELKLLLGPYCLMGVTKARPSKRNRCEVKLNVNDTINVIETLENGTTFVRRNMSTFGIDLMHCDGIGGKLWARHRSQLANDNLRLLEALNSMKIAPTLLDDDADSDNEVTTRARSMCCCENCVLRGNP